MGWDALQFVCLTREQMEKRRIRAGKDLKAGMKQADIARKYGVSRASVSRWDKALREKGEKGLKMNRATGQPPKLSKEDQKRLKKMLRKSPRSYGWKNDTWNSKRIAELIRKKFKVEYHHNHIPKLMKRLDYRPVKPKRQPKEKDNEKKQEWLTTTWVEVKKT